MLARMCLMLLLLMWPLSLPCQLLATHTHTRHTSRPPVGKPHDPQFRHINNSTERKLGVDGGALRARLGLLHLHGANRG